MNLAKQKALRREYGNAGEEGELVRLKDLLGVC